MKININQKIFNHPLFIFLLPMFFVFHGYVENYDLVPAWDAVLLTGIYIGVSLLFSLLFWIFFRNFFKASLAAFCVMAFYFFFGSVQDMLKNNFPGSFFSSYRFIFPASFCIFIFLILYIKKRKRPFSRTTKYLNILLLLLLIIEAVFLIPKSAKHPGNMSTNDSVVVCDSCQKPDIFLIVTDEYAGEIELRDIFSFDNTPFLTELKKRDFHVVNNTFSNYNFTEYSVPSMFNMEYLTGISGDFSSLQDISICNKILKQSKALHFLISQGYDFYNYSIFDFNGQPSIATPTFLLRKTVPITSQTFLSRIKKDLGYHLITTFKLKSVVEKFYYQDLYNNDKISELTKKMASEKKEKPKFVYTHLVMPHYRYYFNSKGEPTPFEKILDDNYCSDKNAYIEYLQYTNGKLLALLDQVIISSEKPPVVILMSDHGYRQFLTDSDIKNVDKKYYFMSLNAIKFPNGNYSQFYDSMSNINQFRVILNSLFQQKLPLLKDSTIFLRQ